MPTTLTLTTPIAAARTSHAERPGVRLAVYAGPAEPPRIDHLEDDDAVALIEVVCDAVYEHSPLPAPAVREIVENLVHAGFADAVVSILDAGHTVRVSDHGPGIDDPSRARTPGFTSARAEARAIVRGVGGGLPLADALLADAGGTLEMTPNLGGGVVVTLRVPPPDTTPAEPVPSGTARMILALLLEVGSADAERLARELHASRSECGRELAALQHRGLVIRESGGARRLTEAGAALVATLF